MRPYIPKGRHTQFGYYLYERYTFFCVNKIEYEKLKIHICMHRDTSQCKQTTYIACYC